MGRSFFGIIIYMKIPISAMVFCHNEEENLPALFNSLKDMDEIIIIDHLSTDNTAKKSKELGAQVITVGNLIETITEDDVNQFELMYGYKPIYTAGNTVSDFGRERNLMVKKCKNDWVYFPDADEVLRWDFESVQRLMHDYDLIVCDFVHTHTSDGKPGTVYDTTKLYKKSKGWWQGRIHEFVNGYQVKTVKAAKMRIDHWQKPKENRKTYLPILEYSCMKEPNSRSQFYLAREYIASEMWKKAYDMFLISLTTAYNPQEIADSYNYLAVAAWQLGKSRETYSFCFESIKTNPRSRVPYEIMIKYGKPEDREQWEKFLNVL